MNFATAQDGFVLSNGTRIPCIGFGTWQTPDGQTAIDAVSHALVAGYRHVDAAAVYHNEKSVGQGIAKGLAAAGLAREDIFVTSKVWNDDRGYESTKRALHKTLDDLGLSYLDLYLIHWPASDYRFADWEQINLDTWRAMTEMYHEGLIKAIGVSNFWPRHLEALMQTEVKPMVNQIEFHPGELHQEVVDCCIANDIIVEAWSPLGSGRVLSDGRLAAIAAHYDVSVARLCVRWALQHGILPLPKSVTPARIDENLDVFGFEITVDDMAAIDAITYPGVTSMHPDKADF